MSVLTLNSASFVASHVTICSHNCSSCCEIVSNCAYYSVVSVAALPSGKIMGKSANHLRAEHLVLCRAYEGPGAGETAESPEVYGFDPPKDPCPHAGPHQ